MPAKKQDTQSKPVGRQPNRLLQAQKDQIYAKIAQVQEILRSAHGVDARVEPYELAPKYVYRTYDYATILTVPTGIDSRNFGQRRIRIEFSRSQDTVKMRILSSRVGGKPVGGGIWDFNEAAPARIAQRLADTFSKLRRDAGHQYQMWQAARRGEAIAEELFELAAVLNAEYPDSKLRASVDAGHIVLSLRSHDKAYLKRVYEAVALVPTEGQRTEK